MAAILMLIGCKNAVNNHEEASGNSIPSGDIAISQVEPLCWWTDMSTPLTLLIHGDDICGAKVSVVNEDGKTSRGLTVRSQHNAESPNYLFVDMKVRKAGNYNIMLTKEGRTACIPYTIMERREGSRERKSFTSADVIYLLMPDRFQDGDTTNNVTPFTIEPTNKAFIHGRQGGDIQGIINNLDHIHQLGATVVWPTPLTLDNEPMFSYHGYACADYYHIDPRFGSNEQYREMVALAHQKGLRFIMDIVTNHCGLAHWWISDLPYHDWIHQFPEYTVTNNVFSTNYDPNASAYDAQLNDAGWFDTHMPDMNLDNPDLLQYFKQFAIWWIEWADLDGLRVDTYPYNEKGPMSEWCKAVRKEYPNINIVGECWTRPASDVAYWQADHANKDGFNSHLPSVMDFPVEEAIRQALENDGQGWGNGTCRIYDAVSRDGEYADISHLLLFAGNHDMEHIADVVYHNDLRRVKLAMTMIATMRGIPQLFAGDEYAQRSADITMGHSGLRQPLPVAGEISGEQQDMFDYQSQLFQFRKSEPVLHEGKTMHFHARDNTYAYFRYNDAGAVFVFINASEETKMVPWSHYNEILEKYEPIGFNVLKDDVVVAGGEMPVAPLSALVVKFNGAQAAE